MTMAAEPAWPLTKLSALWLGRRLAVEVPATDPGRRAFVDVTPRAVEGDAHARREGWTYWSDARSFRIEHWEYDAGLLDGFDYDIGSTLLRSADAANELDLLTVLGEWRANRGKSVRMCPYLDGTLLMPTWPVNDRRSQECPHRCGTYDGPEDADQMRSSRKS
ncbi:hypothetical protein [Actinoplanes sp. NPDC051494]|uniref:hypothetical protein n=1 Tax=Actinoplanes sp. NPDC051494 TaxID=3363907 RepID=UPI003797BD2F